MLDFDQASLYEVETKALNQAVKRNAKRFPKDFMFRLTVSEWHHIRSKTVTETGPEKICGHKLLPHPRAKGIPR